MWRSWAAVGEPPRGPGGGAHGGRSRPGQDSRGAGPEAWAPGAFPAGAVRCRRRRRRRCCWSRCRCWNSCRDLSMFLSARSPQPRHPAPNPPQSHSPEPTPGASRQAPAANPGEGTPLSGSPQQLPAAPPPPTGGSAAPRSEAEGQASVSSAPAGSCARARAFLSPLVPAPSSPWLPTAPGSHPAPSRGPQSPLSCAPFASGVWLLPALGLNSPPVYLRCPGFLRSRASASFSGEGTSVFSKHQSALDGLFTGVGGVWLQDCFSCWAA